MNSTRIAVLSTLAVAALFAGGCHRDMWQQPRYEPLSESESFPDLAASRPIPASTVARGQLREDDLLYTGKLPNGKFANQFPYPVTEDVMRQGRKQFGVFCTPCHGQAGDGLGMIALRGQWKKMPQSFHIERLRRAEHGYFFDVITNGFGTMYPYGSRINARDRWAIVAYIRALQLSQGAKTTELSPEDLQKLNEAASQGAGGSHGDTHNGAHNGSPNNTHTNETPTTGH